jgi:hypothetical protein
MFTNRGAKVDQKFFAFDICPEFFFEADPSVVRAPARVCDKCGEVIGMLRWQAPLRGSLVLKGRQYDIASALGTGAVLLSAKANAALDAGGVKGLKDRMPIDLISNDGPMGKLDYYMAEVAHWGAELDSVASGVKRQEGPICAECRQGGIILGYDRLAIVKGSWNGDDLFTLRGLNALVASGKFVEVCRKSRLAVCNLVPIEQYWRPFIPLE